MLLCTTLSYFSNRGQERGHTLTYEGKQNTTTPPSPPPKPKKVHENHEVTGKMVISKPQLRWRCHQHWKTCVTQVAATAEDSGNCFGEQPVKRPVNISIL